jgi:hypothetical protein
MDAYTSYTKTARGLRALVKKLPHDAGLVLSAIDKNLTAEEINAKIGNIDETDLEFAITWLLEGGFIKSIKIDPFPNSMWNVSSNNAIEVDEIDIAQFTVSEKPPVINKTKEELAAEATKQAEFEAKKKILEKADEEARLRAEAALKAKTDSEAETISNKEALAKKVAEENARLQREAREKAEAEAKAKAVAEENARKEAEAKRKAEEKAAAEEKARLEKAEKEKQAAIEKAEREAREKAEAEAKAKAVAEENARKEAEAKRKAEEKAVAEENARKEAEAKRKAEEKAAAEENARKEAEAKRKAEEKAAAKEQARLEKEEKAKQKALEKTEKEEHAKEEAAIKEQAKLELAEKARLKALDEAELRAVAQIAAEKKALEKAAVKEQARLEALAVKEEKAQTKAHEIAKKQIKREKLVKNIRRNIPGKQWLINIANNIKPISMFAIAVVLLLIIAAQFINMSILINPIEKIAKNTIQDNVNIHAINISLFPKPHLLLKDITVADRKTINAKKIRIYPNLLNLKDKLFNIAKGPYEIQTIEIEGFNIAQKDIERVVSWSGASSRNQELKIKTITVSDLLINLNVLQLPLFNGSINLDEAGMLKNAEFSSEKKNLKIVINKTVNDYILDIEGVRWRAPMSPYPIFTKIIGKGVIHNNVLSLNGINSDLYNGSLNATLEMDLNNPKLASKGDFKIDSLYVGDMAKELQLDTQFDGKLNIEGKYAFEINQTSNSAIFTDFDARFEVKKGQLRKVDLAEAMRSGNLSGSTEFKTLTGLVSFHNERYQFRNLNLKDNQLSATGQLSLTTDDHVDGVISTSIAVKSKTIRSRLLIDGPITALKLKN